MSRSARYSLNFRAHKICLNKLPDFMKPRVKTLNVHLDAINCDPFFYWDKKNNPAEISLDNPKMPKILRSIQNWKKNTFWEVFFVMLTERIFG